MKTETCDSCGHGADRKNSRPYRRTGWTTNGEGKRIPVLEEISWEEFGYLNGLKNKENN